MSEGTRRGFPLFALVTAGAAGLVLLATAAVGLTTYTSSRQSVDKLWHELAIGLDEYATRECLRFLEPAVPFTASTADLARSGRLDVQDDEAMLAYLEVALDANPHFTWASLGRADGTYLSALRWPSADGGVVVRRTARRVLPEVDPESGVHQARFEEAERRPDRTWAPLPESVRPYDPRVRPWYTAAADLPPGQGVWIDPFLYLSRAQPGVNYSRPVRAADGTLLGVVSAEFEARPLSDFVASLDVGDRGRVYVLSADGAVVAHAAHQLVDETGAAPRIHQAETHPDEMLRSAWAALGERGGPDGRPFEFGPYLAAAMPFPAASGIPWLVLTVVPSDDFYGGVRGQVRRSLWIALVAVVLAVLIGLLLSRVLASAVRALREEMHSLARFEIHEGGFEATTSLVRELNDMGSATGVMKRGLRSFGRYVPHQLVRQLLRSGVEARLGGDEREVTVLFSDIAGFTPVVESTPADVVLTALGEYLGRMNEAIARTDGTVCQYLGDAIMAFWGAPERQPDHALRACRGALAMRREAAALVASAAERGAPALPTRFGLNTGLCMVGNIGAPNRFNYAILGDPVNAASRVEGLNKVYGTWILIGERTAAQVGDALVLRRVDQVRMKGRVRHMAVYELVGEPDEVAASTRAAITAYEAALDRYLAGDFAGARDDFVAALAAFGGDDGPSRALAERCREYQDHPPPAGWDGVHTMQRK